MKVAGYAIISMTRWIYKESMVHFQVPTIYVDVSRLFAQARYLFLATLVFSFSAVVAVTAAPGDNQTPWWALAVVVCSVYTYYVQLPYFILANYANLYTRNYGDKTVCILRGLLLVCFIAVYFGVWTALKQEGVSIQDRVDWLLLHSILTAMCWIALIFMMSEGKFKSKKLKEG
jgi:hypothetical protein